MPTKAPTKPVKPAAEELTYFSVRNMPKRLVNRIRLLATLEQGRIGERVTIEEMHTRVVRAGLPIVEAQQKAEARG